MKGERLRMRPASEFTGLRTQYIRNSSVGVHESERDEEADTENTPSDLLEFPEHIGMSEALEPEVFRIEICQRHERAHTDERAEYPEEIRLKFGCASLALSAPSVPKDTPYKGNRSEEYAEEQLCDGEVRCHACRVLL